MKPINPLHTQYTYSGMLIGNNFCGIILFGVRHQWVMSSSAFASVRLMSDPIQVGFIPHICWCTINPYASQCNESQTHVNLKWRVSRLVSIASKQSDWLILLWTSGRIIEAFDWWSDSLRNLCPTELYPLTKWCLNKKYKQLAGFDCFDSIRFDSVGFSIKYLHMHSWRWAQHSKKFERSIRFHPWTTFKYVKVSVEIH